MSIIIAIIIFMVISGKTKKDNRNSSLFRTIFIVIAALIVVGSILPFLTDIAIFALVVYGIIRLIKSIKTQNQIKESGWDPERWKNSRTADNIYNQFQAYKDQYKAERQAQRNEQKSQSNEDTGNAAQRMAENSSLPYAVKKRKRIVSNFNEKYNLCLTPEQIQSIVNSSYMSEIWLHEIEAMNQKYQAVYQWFTGCTSWLRVYLYVFHVQEISSDMLHQQNISLYAFNDVFCYTDSLPDDMPLNDMIAEVNRKYLTAFDDVSFMIAYRFLESNGFRHKLPNPEVIRNDSEIDELLEKYKNSGGTTSQP